MIDTRHTSFEIDRTFSATPDAVFRAWADADAKRQWSDCHADNTVEFSLDFRPLCRETHRVLDPVHGEQVVEKVFFDIVPDKRIIFSYDITVAGKRLSVSLVTVEFSGDGGGTRMLYTEQLAYLDGHHDLAMRIHGTKEGLDRLRLVVEADSQRMQ